MKLPKEWTKELNDEAERIMHEAPVELFGKNVKRAENTHKNMRRKFHPDVFVHVGSKALTDEAAVVFKELEEKWEKWEKAMGLGKSPKPGTAPVASNAIQLGSDMYVIQGIAHESGSMKVFHVKDAAGEDSYLVVARQVVPAFNVERLKSIVSATWKAGKYDDYFPTLVKHGFTIPQETGKHSAVLIKIDGFEAFRSLGYFRRLGKHILHPKDIAWIWRRVLSVGAIHTDHKVPWVFDPDYEFIRPEDHANISLSALSSMSSGSAAMQSAKFTGELMQMDAPTKLKNYFNAVACGAGEKEHPAQLLLDFDYVIKQTWGERKFHEFVFPAGYTR